jgi:hypothetical protein
LIAVILIAAIVFAIVRSRRTSDPVAQRKKSDEEDVKEITLSKPEPKSKENESG